MRLVANSAGPTTWHGCSDSARSGKSGRAGRECSARGVGRDVK